MLHTYIKNKEPNMSKETPELITECWQLLMDYIPRRDQMMAAEQLFSYLTTVLDKEELEAIADLDSDLSDAYITLSKENEDFDTEENDDE